MALLAGLVIWQYSIFRTNQPATYRVDATGLMNDDRFVYFLYYLNLYPMASTRAGRNFEFYFDDREHPVEPDTLDYSQDGARRLLASDGDTLVTEWGHSIRTGNYLQTYLYLFDAWRLGTARQAEVRIANGAAFVAGLALVLVSSWSIRLTGLGILLVALMGSNPFQVYEAYRRENIFSWPITTFCLTLAVMLPILTGRVKWRWYAVAAAVASGGILATVLQIRPENGSMVVSVVAALLLNPAASIRHRARDVVVFVTVLLSGLVLWNSYFDRKFAETEAVVRAAGGHVYTGPRDVSHPFWDRLWGGLGDFDEKYGYSFAEPVQNAYIAPILQQEYGESLPWWWGPKAEREATDYFDTARIYYRQPLQTPHAQEVLRDKVLRDITHDPLWYLGILAKRLRRVLTQTTPVRLYAGDGEVPILFPGWFAVLVAAAAAVRRDGTGLRLLLFSLAPSLTAVLLYSGNNTPHYGVYHIVAAALVGWWTITALNNRFGRRLRAAA